MESSIFKKAGEFLAQKSKRRNWQVAVAALGIVVIVSTAYVLSKPAQTLVKETYCGMEEHEHTEECYEQTLVCELEEANAAADGSAEGETPEVVPTPVPVQASNEEKQPEYIDVRILACGQEVSHVHTLNCFAGAQDLICGQEESEEHSHTEECHAVTVIKALTCELEETEEHTHGDECYTVVGARRFTCTEAESENHTHGDGCYTELGDDELLCKAEKAEGHTHTDECYTVTEKKDLTCKEEEAEGHTHGDDCYTTTTKEELVCQDESEEHEHTAECYQTTEEWELACEKEETAGHTHTDECYTVTEEKTLTCDQEEVAAVEAEHVHTLACSAMVQKEVPATEAADATDTENVENTESTENTEDAENAETTEKHVHTDECYALMLVCGYEEHTHSDLCREEPKCGIEAHTHRPDCYDEEGNLVCEAEEHKHVENCYKDPHCGINVHLHTEECYDEEGNLICGLEEHLHGEECYFEIPTYYCLDRMHVHSGECRDEEENIICGYADFVVHTHDEACYDPNMRLICPLPEIEAHTHTEECYVQESEEEEPKLVCEKEEIILHTHSEECFNEENNLICGQMEILVHQHNDACYEEKAEQPDDNQVETPVKEIAFYCADRIHVHTDACYDAEGKQVCGQADYVIHTHNEECYDDNMKLICPLAEEEEHIHGTECIGEGSELVCGKEQKEVHEHSAECYDENGNLTCGKLEILRHEHSAECHVEDKEETRAEVAYYCLEMIHQHTEECYDEAGSLICGEADYVAHTHTEECYNEEGQLICPLAELEAHVHSEECFAEDTEEAEPVCGRDEVKLHAHTEECYGENGELICGQMEVTEHVHNGDCHVSHAPITKTYQNAKFIVTATYKPDANIPDEAELIVEEITAESDEEHYEQRQAEYQEAVGDDKATIRALLKIGFYLDGAEIEPASPVTVTIQFLDENGLEEGKPITVMHFAEEGSELLDGSKVERGSTTFEMDSFSEVLVGYGAENVKVEVDEDIEYKTDAFDITFHIKGEVSVPIDGRTEVNADGTETPVEGELETAGNESTEPTENLEQPSDNEDTVVVSIANEKLAEDFEFKVEAVEEESDEYAAMVAYGEEVGDSGEELLAQVWSYSLNYKDAEVDLSNCTVMIEVTPSQAFIDAVKESANTMAIGEPGEMDGITDSLMDTDASGLMEGTAGGSNSVFLSLMNISADGEIDEIDTTVVGDKEEATENTEEGTTAKIYSNSRYFGARASGQPNPSFTVQYYANLDVMVYNDDHYKKQVDDTQYTNELPVIDTSGGKLPQNGKGKEESPNENAIRNLYVNMTDNKEEGQVKGQLATKKNLTEVYELRNFEYYKAPTINYVNALLGKPNYSLKEVWVYNPNSPVKSSENIVCGKESTHEHDETCYKENWTIYPYSSDLHFTNRSVSAVGNNKYILISEGTTLRLVYDTEKDNPNFVVQFYDYDIGDGKIYSTEVNAKEQKNGVSTSSQGAGTWYMHTEKSGINSDVNYTDAETKPKLAFGNANTGSGYQHEKWNGNLLNKFNGTQDGHPSVSGSYKGCTFGLATRMNEGKIVYADSVSVPNLFNDGYAEGKTNYDENEFSLKFNRNGDTYTLSAVNNTGTSRLEAFEHPIPEGYKKNNKQVVHNHIWTNNFWPMDSAQSYGTDGHDMKFGNYYNRSKYKFAGKEGGGPDYYNVDNNAKASGTFPWSDDGKDHNSYFGMHYTVEFDLVADYIGPLEYYFFGDDDMWVFLDGKLVCDIGGVHSSVGEYLNLWDYIDKTAQKIHVHDKGDCYNDKNELTCGFVDSKKFTLDFYYTERGESGSTCWMQFTLPSVTSVQPPMPDDEYGHLRIEKTVTQVNDGEENIVDNNDEFTFKVHFTDAMGNNLPDDYSYVKFDKNGKEIGADLIIWDGGDFTLKNGEYVIVKYLPKGTKYEITELNGAITVTTDSLGNEVKENSRVEYFTDITGDGNDKKGVLADKVAMGDIEENTTKEIKYNNKFYTYNLPETGGSGTTLYTIAGVIVLLGSAGLVYRKKFRERRV